MATNLDAATSSLAELLPHIWRHVLPDFFAQPAPLERHATCDDCAMCRPGPSSPGFESVTFCNDTKCCTYYPDLPNFLVGAALESDDDDGDEGRRRLREIIARRVGCTPFGLVAPSRYRLLYGSSVAAFGQASSMVCPLFDSRRGTCTIWPYREAVSITYYCKHVQGENGRLFWAALRDYLLHGELVLAQHALHVLGWSGDQILRGSCESSTGGLVARELDERGEDDRRHRDHWGEWVGREEELFTRAHRVVRQLSSGDFERLAGVRATLLLERLTAAHQRLVECELPDPLLLNPTLEVYRGEDGCVVMSYSRTDPVFLRRDMLQALELFDGRRGTDEVLRLLRWTRGQGLSSSLLKGLYQHRVLIDPAGRA